MPKPYDLNLHKSYNVNNNDKNYKSFTDANGEQWYTDKPLTTYNNNKLAYVTNGRHSKWVTISDQFNTQPQTLSREQAVKRDLIKPRIQAANDLTSGLADIITGGMAGSLRDGAQNLTKGNYLQGISQLATPAMFGSGIAGNIARAGVGSYNLFNKNGVRKTYNHITNQEYGNAAVSGLGDILNAGMAIHGGTQLFKNYRVVKPKLLSANLNNKNLPYYSQFEQKEAQQRMASDIKRGYQNFKDWMTNPHYLEATLDNIEEAKRMGLKYTPTYDKPQYKALMQNGIKINFKKQMHGMGATSQFGAQAGHPAEVDLNLGTPQSFFNTVRHETGHAAYHGNGLTANELKYLRFKTHQAFIDNAKAGPYDFHQQTGEAAMNGRDLGHDLGISVGQSYPGYQKALETLNSGLGKSTKDGMIKLFKTDEQSMPYVWKLLNGTLLGGALMTKININK